MLRGELSLIEKKVFGALLIMSDDNLEVKGKSQIDIAKVMGYVRQGGVIGSALRVLEMLNYIRILGKQHYQVLL
jgi:hypothetical protein